MKLAVIGGGLSGLAVSHHLVKAGHEVTCFEASDRPGGLIRSEKRDGFLCEVGPQARPALQSGLITQEPPTSDGLAQVPHASSFRLQ